ncbi:hypothetical protein V7122_16955 [Bacillus sp. JJ1532]|uniref:hypothetical protein n=1 Tax=Bacillus sp. JJ1532 TaxID=3122958 RepID=UPI002FFE4864
MRVSKFMVFSFVALFMFLFSASDASAKVMWGKTELKKGQIGKVTIITDIRATKILGNDVHDPKSFQNDKLLKEGEEYRVYSYRVVGDRKFYGLGGGLFVQKSNNTKYETPSKAKLALLGNHPIKNPVNTGKDKVVVTDFGNLKGTVTWQYNKFIGTKPDVGANVFLIPTNFDPSKYSKSQLDLFSTIGSIPEGSNMHHVKANGYGNYELNNIPVGEYVLLISSNNTTRDFTQPIDESTEEMLLRLLGNGYEIFMQFNLELQNHDWTTVEIQKNTTQDKSIDFGYTFI